MLKAIHRMQRDERGFTLVELLIVIAIIAILAAIAIPQFSSYRAKAALSGCQSDGKNCVNQCAALVADNPSASGSCGCIASPGNTITGTIDTNGTPTISVTCGGAATGKTCTYANNSISCS